MSESHFLPVTDNHLHVDPVLGLGPVEVGKLFWRAGGSHAFVVNKMVDWGGVSPEAPGDFARGIEGFLKLVDKMNAKTPIKAFAVVGPHPAQLVRLAEAVGVDRAAGIMREALASSARFVARGRAVALGEVGRPHFEVGPELLEASNRLLDLALETAADIGCAVQLHMEGSTPEQYQELSSRAIAAGLPPEKVIKHFSPPLVSVGSATGIMPSVTASRKNIEAALSQGDRFLMETDYIDDRQRPGAVLGPKTVPRLTRQLMAEGILRESSAERIHREHVERTYGVEVTL